MLYNKNQQLLFFKRFIDDIMVIWAGDRESLTDFCFDLNSIEKDIKLSWEESDEKIHFLDLEIIRKGERLVMQTYFKPVDRNSYFSLEICHYTPWLDNIPKSQLIRLRRNCTEKYIFLKQAKLIGGRFIQKG